MNIRKSIYSLTTAPGGELEDFQAALNAIKADGSYDDFIRRHHHSMMTPTPMPGETSDANTRNVAHRGPAFLPWHRYFCRELELMLQTKRPNVTLPYWDWTVDSANPLGAALWNTDPSAGPVYVGGDGTGPGGTITGPFAHWKALIEDPTTGTLVQRAGIVREFNQFAMPPGQPNNPLFPTAVQVTDVVDNFTVYDTSPWRTASTGSFRNRLEGWARTMAGEGGPQLHNRVHVWIGGDMGPGTSPNDPVFFLHHCNIDRLWARWQYKHTSSPYVPDTGGPPGHNLHDQMQHLTSADPTPARSLNYGQNLGYIYDTDPPTVDLATPSVNFQDVATLETTWRAATFRVRAASPIHLEVVSGPAPPYGLTALGGSVTHQPVQDNAPFDEVRVWFAFTGDAAAGPAPEGTADIQCLETGDIFRVTLTANTVAPPTVGVVFCLDRSGSMGQPAGSGPTRMEVLHEAAERCAELMRDFSGAGVVSFDQVAYPGVDLAPFLDTNNQRTDVFNAIAGLTPGGATSIGNGVVLARQTLVAGASSFAQRAIVVLTDGLENTPLFLDQVGPSIDDRTFAIGLGTAQQVSVGALSKLANNTDGFLLLTGPLTPDTDGYFRLSKYFQQILVSATNENIVTDPSGFIAPGQKLRIPFELADTDIDATAVLLMDLPAVNLHLESPTGFPLAEPDLIALGAKVEHGTNMTYARLPLPLPIEAGAGAHGGTWQVVLTVDRASFNRQLKKLKGAAEKDPAARIALERMQSHGLRYSVSVTTWSNLRLAARLTQSSLEPGAALRIDATLVEFGLPLSDRARVEAEVVRPDGITTSVELAEEQPGAFAAELQAQQEGVWRVRIRATGHTFGGVAFSREQLLSAAVVRGGDQPSRPRGGGEADACRCLVECLLEDEGVRRLCEERGIDAKAIAECARRCAHGGLSEEELRQLG